MNYIKLLLADSDYEYTKVLGRTLANRFPIFHVEILDADIDIIIQQLKDNSYDLILIDSEYREKQFYDHNSKIIWLSDNKLEVDNKENLLYRYSGVDEISSRLQLIHAKLSGMKKTHCNDLQANLVGFTGAAGGVGKTSIAIATARELSSFHNFKVLYLSMEEHESTAIYFTKDGGKNTISDYIYYLYSRNESHLASYIDSFIYKDEYGLEVFRPSKGINELIMLSKEDTSYFLESVCKFRNYHYICIDFKASGSEQSMYLFNNCNKIILIDDSSPLSIYKNNKFEKYLNIFLNQKLDDKIIRVRNKWVAKEENLPSPEILVLENDTESFIYGEDFIEININYGFGMGVKKLAEEIRKDV